MNFYIQRLLYFFLVAMLVWACDSKPKVIEAEPGSTATSDPNSIPAFKDVPGMQENTTSAEHKVVVEEVLNTNKYTYLHVAENEDKRWIAIPKTDVEVGDTYFYKGGLMKRNFYSQEFDRTFETVYLVSNIWKQAAEGGSGSALDEALAKSQRKESVDLTVGNIQLAEGAISISELLANKEKYNGKLVKITGKVVKVNPMIMQRNWLHIKDSSSGEQDLTVTTTEKIPLGAVLSLEGTIAVDKDFGAGYRYDIIMEGAVMQ